ncbi:hypothetical protein, partial [Enterococcus faecium]
DKYHNSIYANPKVAQTHIGLAQTLEKLSPADSKDIRNSIVQWHAYLDLSPDLLPQEVEKINKHLVSLDKQAVRLEAKEAK